MRYLYIILALILSSCGHMPTRTWPAIISSMNGFTDAQRAEVIKYVYDLNAFVGHDIIVLDRANAFVITFKFVNERELDAETIGVAHTDDYKCDIDLSSLLFDDLKPYAKSTTWHEIGHCAGLDHIAPRSGEIMSPEALPFYEYGAKELFRFKTDILKAIGVTK